jgi:hypothetical protein
MLLGAEIRKRLLAKLQVEGIGGERERIAEWAITKSIPEIIKIVNEQVRIERSKKNA